MPFSVVVLTAVTDAPAPRTPPATVILPIVILETFTGSVNTRRITSPAAYTAEALVLVEMCVIEALSAETISAGTVNATLLFAVLPAASTTLLFANVSVLCVCVPTKAARPPPVPKVIV